MANYGISLLKQVIVFSSFLKYRNLSRIDPMVISTGVHNSNYFHPVGGGAPYVFTSLILVSSCHLDEPKTSHAGRKQKIVEGACIEGEWERLVGCIGHIIRSREFTSQVAAGNLSFTTSFTTAKTCELSCGICVFCMLVLTLFYNSAFIILHVRSACQCCKLVFTRTCWS